MILFYLRHSSRAMGSGPAGDGKAGAIREGIFGHFIVVIIVIDVIYKLFFSFLFDSRWRFWQNGGGP